ncbi:MAG: CoA protein activase [Eubacteriales bacterium]
MKVTFPHMGNAYISIKALLDTIGIDYFMPPVENKKTMEYGIINSPEFICLPFKLVLGDLIQGLNNGADVIIFGGGCGQCRLCYYGDLMQEILINLGYKFQYIDLELDKMSYYNIIKKFKPVIKNKSLFLVILGITRGIQTVFATDKLYKLASRTRCREIRKGSTDKIMNKFENNIQKITGFANIKNALKSASKSLKNIETDKNKIPLRISIIGEIFIASDPFTNLQIVRKLGNMGAEVSNSISVGSWIREHFIYNLMPIKPKDKPVEAAQEYMKIDEFGGHGIYTVGNAILNSKAKFDGIIQIYPFTCMPEIIAQCTFNEIQKKYKTPIMTLILDEMTGEAGYITRLEAFVDMLDMKKSNMENIIRAKNNKVCHKHI